MPPAMLCRHRAHAFICKESFVGLKLQLASIVAEIEAYSFERMRDSSESGEDDVHWSQDERRRGNTSWCATEKVQRRA